MVHYVVDGLLFAVVLWIVLSHDSELCALRRELKGNWDANSDLWRALNDQKLAMLGRLSKVRGRVHNIETELTHHAKQLYGDGALGVHDEELENK